jgi:ElaB/YqjD/DUF883 family membrane-anchored ribosome-binding protein
MSQSLELNLKTTSDVPQAVDKAKQAVTNFSKQVEEVNKKSNQTAKQETEKAGSQIEGIQKRFGNSFKDIFLSVLGPMALFTAAMALVGKLIEENRKKQEDAKQAAVDGTNEMISAEDRYYQTKRANEKKSKEDAEQAKLSREQTTFEFMQNDPRGYKIYQDYVAGRIGDTSRGDVGLRDRKYNARYDAQVQAAVAAIIAEDAKKNPLNIKEPDQKLKDFKGPEGFSNVIGVGPNPVLEAMAQQTEIALAQLAELQKISGSTPVGQGDFTKGTQSK